jgi:hypothetical protein
LKNYLKIWIIISIGLVSCKKDHRPIAPTVDSGKFYSLNFRLDPTGKLIHSNKPGSNLKVNSDEVPAAGSLKTLTYLLYDSNGKYLSRIVQDTTFANFGNISDSVRAGTYSVFFLGNASIKVDDALNRSYFYPNATLPPGNDLYYHKETVVVTNNSISNNIVLDRTTAMLELDIQDAVPADAASITIDANEFSGYMVGDTSITAGERKLTTHIFTAAEKGTQHVKIDKLIYLPKVAKSLTITVYLANGQIRNKINVTATLIRNHKTILSGTVFDKTGDNNDWTVSINTDWGNSTTIDF